MSECENCKKLQEEVEKLVEQLDQQTLNLLDVEGQLHFALQELQYVLSPNQEKK